MPNFIRIGNTVFEARSVRQATIVPQGRGYTISVELKSNSTADYGSYGTYEDAERMFNRAFGIKTYNAVPRDTYPIAPESLPAQYPGTAWQPLTSVLGGFDADN